MKFALVNGQRQEAQPNLPGNCPACGHPMVAKCGEIKIWHWAHKSRRLCDPWWENETEWHRAWKEQFPVHWQEVVHKAENGEKHIADVKTDHGWVVEFQHSPIKPEERRSRDAFYRKLVWVVNGARRKTDSKQFLNALKRGMQVGGNSHVGRVLSDECALLREWAGSHAPIFFDFGGDVLWWLLSKTPNGPVYVAPFARTDFIEIYRGGTSQKFHDFEEFIKDFDELVAHYEGAHAAKQARPQPPRSFQQSFARRSKRSRRL